MVKAKSNLITKLKDFIRKILTNASVKLFIFYVFFAGIASVVDVSILFVLTEYAGFHYLISSALSYLAGMITNYSLNKFLTFKNYDKRIARQFSLFVMVALVGLALNQLFLYIMVEHFGMWYILAKLISICLVGFWSFFGHKKITFKNLLVK